MLSPRQVGASDVEEVRQVMVLFSQIDQRRGGGHGRNAVVQYLSGEVVAYLQGPTPMIVCDRTCSPLRRRWRTWQGG